LIEKFLEETDYQNKDNVSSDYGLLYKVSEFSSDSSGLDINRHN